MVSPDLLTKFPPPAFPTAASTYPLLTACPACEGVGKVGATLNCFVPVIVSVPLRCTTLASCAFTYCWVANCEPGLPNPPSVLTCAMVAGEAVPTDQYSIFTVPSVS